MGLAQRKTNAAQLADSHASNGQHMRICDRWGRATTQKFDIENVRGIAKKANIDAESNERLTLASC